MPTLDGQNILPGVYSQIQPNLLPTGAAGLRVPAFIGTGRLTNLVSNEQVIRGVTAPPATDALDHTATSLDGNIQDANFIIYQNGVDFSLVSGGVHWLSSAAFVVGTIAGPYVGLSGLNFQVAISTTSTPGSVQIIPFTTETTATQVMTTLNNYFTANSIAAVASLNAGAVEVATTATSDANIYIGTGTANAILGFTAGSYQQTPQAPASGVAYYVTYEYAKVSADYTPKFYFTLQAVTNDYGPVISSTSIPTACSLAFQNGAAVVCVCQENPADGSPVAQVQQALNKLLSTQNISIVVSLEGTHNAQLISAIKQHVDIASSTINRLERTAMIGYEGVFSDTDMLNLALAANDKRIVSINQSATTNTMIIGTDTNASVVGGQYLAAALAGVRCNPSFDVAQPMTREIISGIVTSNTLTQAEKSLLVNQGVCMIDNVSGVPKVLFGTSTDFSTVANQLFQVTQIMDYVAQTLRGLLDPIFIGQKLLSTTPSQIQTVTAATLTTIQNSTIIVSFTPPVATVDPTVPTQIDLQVGVQPTLEVDVIFITLGLNLI